MTSGILRTTLSNRFSSSHNSQLLNQTYVDLVFGVTGQEINREHGYQLYAALSSYKPLLHYLEGISIQLINGSPIQKNIIRLTKQSRLRMRLPNDQISNFYSLAGKVFSIGSQEIRLGIPQIHPLEAAQNLYSPIVVIRGYQEPSSFLEAAYRQLQKLDIEARINLLTNSNSEPSRRTMRVKQFTLIGFGLEVTNLCEQDSLLLQVHGLGGKQKMGCGFFTPQLNTIGNR
ncbi:type I-MYXAN CRISPR-associated protein Cas6/Cmx6 [Phormidium sp. FACHB-592]|uniref:Type I-MYXAN CRISPR-associated protein Cas6/Cmx6 n=1 Tax=Stenomitos frigidus AS-A4 TaxID=2933935 RepID=A0ABV0KKU2_9CYAN|nr:type I-MYXAN CRISPR-associated protein Cas6/Cmx6 [Phormidium sp. FACHB-592]MBD2076999.1 type I-MYXAN CRISPR-associated protein Cas6/Cmx6 [Phormidium sp. FACHB-592]